MQGMPIEVGEDRKSVSIAVNLLADMTYEILIDLYPGQPEGGPSLFYYGGTVALSDGSVAGTISLPEGINANDVSGTVLMLQGNAKELVAIDSFNTKIIHNKM